MYVYVGPFQCTLHSHLPQRFEESVFYRFLAQNHPTHMYKVGGIDRTRAQLSSNPKLRACKMLQLITKQHTLSKIYISISYFIDIVTKYKSKITILETHEY